MTTRTIHVTAAQVRAAKALLEDPRHDGDVDERLRLIADTDLDASTVAPAGAPAPTGPRRGPAPAQ